MSELDGGELNLSGLSHLTQYPEYSDVGRLGELMSAFESKEEILNLVTDICEIDFKFDNFLDVSAHFKKMINLCKQMNYSVYKSEQYYDFKNQVEAMLADHK